MTPSAATFLPEASADTPDDAVGASRAVGALAATGAEAHRAVTVHAVVLDTVDRLLRARAMRVIERSVSGGGIELELAEVGSPTVRVTLDAPVRFAVDLPPGPLRSRLRQAVGERALLPVVSVRGLCTQFEKYNSEGKTVARASVWQQVEAGDHRGIALAEFPVELVEVVGATGHVGPAARMRRALDDLGWARAEGDLLDQVEAAALAAGDTMAAGAVRLGARLKRRLPALEGVAIVCTDLLDTFDASRQGAIDDIDPEFLHDLRVAVRRTRSVLGESRDVLAADACAWARDEFGWLGTVTSPARDLDVLVAAWPQYCSGLPDDVVEATAPALELVLADREQAHATLAADLASNRVNDISTGWRTWLHDPEPFDGARSRAAAETGTFVAHRLRRAHERVLTQGRSITDASPAVELHELRKDAKRLRYIAECFEPIVPRRARRDLVARLKLLQDTLGLHQDLDVHAAHLGALLPRLRHAPSGAAASNALHRVIAEVEQRCALVRSEFAERFEAFDNQATHDIVAAITDRLER